MSVYIEFIQLVYYLKRDLSLFVALFRCIASVFERSNGITSN